VSLIGGMIVSVWQAQVARREKAKADSVNRFLAEMLNYTDPNTAVKKGENELITIKDVLDKAAKQIDGEDFAQPEVRAELNYIIGYSYYTQGFYESAEKHVRAAIDLYETAIGVSAAGRIQGQLLLASIMSQRGKRSEADNIFQEIMQPARVEFQKGNLNATMLVNGFHDFAVSRRALGNSKEAEGLLREGLALEAFVPEKERRSLIVARGTLALTLFDQGKLDEAIAMQKEYITALGATAASETWEFGYALTSLGSFLSERRHFAEADENLARGEAIYRQLLGNSHLVLGDNLRIQANLLYQQDQFSGAENKITETLKIYRSNTDEQYFNFATALMIQGLILNETGKHSEAETILREAVRIREKNLPKEHFQTALTIGALGECLTDQRRFAEAEPLLKASYESLINSQGPENPRTLLALRRLEALKQMY